MRPLHSTHTGKPLGWGGCFNSPKQSSLGKGKIPSLAGGALAVLAAKGGLCGNGDISIASGAGPGDEEGIGGVIVLSASVYQHL